MFRRGWLVNLLVALCAGPLACNTFGVAIDVAPPDGPWWSSPKGAQTRTQVAASAKADANSIAAKQPIIQAGNQVPRTAEQRRDAEELIERPPTREQIEKERQAAALNPAPSAQPRPPEQPRQEPAHVPPLVLALQCFLERRPVEAREALKTYDKSSQDFFWSWLLVAGRLIEGGLNRLDSQEATAFVAQLRRLLEMLEPRAELVITKMCFCQGIEKFGVYQAWDENPKFRPKDEIVVYAELQNFTNERVAKGHAVRLSSRVEIRNYRGARIYAYGFPERPDIAQSQRRDCFNGCAFYLDESIPPGLYTLSLHVKDVPTGRTTTRSLDFQVAPYRGRGN